MNKEFRQYNISTNEYRRSINVAREKPLNGFTATNIGDTAVRVNDILLGPAVAPSLIGDSVTIGGNEGEIFGGNIIVSFVLPLAANPLVSITQKFYITKKDFEK